MCTGFRSQHAHCGCLGRAGNGRRSFCDGLGLFDMRRWLVVLAFLCLPIAALAGLTSRDSTYDNACAITGTCTGGGGTASPIMLEHMASSTNPPGNGITGHAFKIQVDTVPTSTVIVVAVE